MKYALLTLIIGILTISYIVFSQQNEEQTKLKQQELVFQRDTIYPLLLKISEHQRRDVERNTVTRTMNIKEDIPYKRKVAPIPSPK